MRVPKVVTIAVLTPPLVVLALCACVAVGRAFGFELFPG